MKEPKAKGNKKETDPTQPQLDVTIDKVKDDALTVLRTETAISRFPLHRIAKKSGDIAIEIHNQAAAVQWSVSHNTKYGQPGPLAYRIDTLLVNRRIEEAGKPVPRLIRLGSLPEIARELGFTGHNWNLLRRAIHQNASAYITAKISYRAADRSERFLEAGFNRYNVIFTGEKLPSGEAADAVYLVLSDIFLDVLNTAMWRPLDYDYMKTLPPGSQRFYEIVSYQIYAALQHGNPRAKFSYAEYCLLSTATRYHDFEHVKKQMYKILRPHIQSGYITKVEYEATLDEKNEPDWIMYLTPGVNANREYQAFTGRGMTRTPKSQAAAKAAAKNAAAGDAMTGALALPFADDTEAEVSQVEGSPSESERDIASPDEAARHEASSDDSGSPVTSGNSAPADSFDRQELIEALTKADLNRADAERFARDKPDQCRRQLEFLPYVKDFKTSRGAYLRRAIEGDYGPPAAYAKARERDEAAQAAQRHRARELFEAQDKKARQSHQERFYEAYIDYLRERVGEAEKAQPEAFTAFKEQEAAQRAVLTEGPFANRPLNQKALEVFDREASRLERCRDYLREQGLHVLTFWEWDETVNPEAYRP